jgi:NAD(P)-dependent dehydrogenase (short-subunit alcohol dehydrogenase family)
MDWIVTGASRGIGAALVKALADGPASGQRLFVLARDKERLASLHASNVELVRLRVDLTQVADARRAGRELAERVAGKAVLIHNAGLWPSQRVLVDGIEAAFAVNCLGPLALQAPLLDRGAASRVLVVSAGLLVHGHFDSKKTPVGDDFSAFRTYCTTKLAGAAAMRDVARSHPQVDFAVVHPGVVNTDLGARQGLLGWILGRIKRRWESPETCARRLVGLLELARWEDTPGDAPWFFESSRQPWPAAVEREAAAIRQAVQQHLSAAGNP